MSDLAQLQVLPEKTKDINDFYHIHKQIGKGTFGIIWECEHRKTGTRLVCKGVPKSHLRSLKDIVEVRNEVEVMKRLAGHPNVVFLVDAFENNDYVYMVMEYCTEGELFDKIQRAKSYNEKEAAAIFYEIALAIHHCHTHNIMHRDLKPENFFLVPVPEQLKDQSVHDFQIKLGDFGLSVILEEGGKTSGTSGSKVYQSPEQLSGREYDLKSDIWSLGVILYVLFSGELPFFGRTKLDIVEEIMDRGVRFEQEVWSSVSDAAKNLITRLLTVEPIHRASSNEVLEDPWLLAHISHPTSPNSSSNASSLSELRVHNEFTENQHTEKQHGETDEILHTSDAHESGSTNEGHVSPKKLSQNSHKSSFKGFLSPFFNNCTHPRVQDKSFDDLMHLQNKLNSKS